MDFVSTEISQLPIFLQAFVIAIAGLIFGSFLSLISHRLITKEAIVFARSQCPKCHYQLKFYNLIPLFSWLFQRGKCSNCHQKISWRYPLIESVIAVVFVANFFINKCLIDQNLLLLCLISATLILMCITDLEHYVIPNIAQYILAIFVILWLIHNKGNDAPIKNLQAAFLYLGFGLLLLWFFYLTTKIEAIGIDDIKFFFIAGLALGVKNFVLFMMMSSVFGLLFGPLWQLIRKERTFPFAPAICVSFYVSLLWGNGINLVGFFGSLIFQN